VLVGGSVVGRGGGRWRWRWRDEVWGFEILREKMCFLARENVFIFSRVNLFQFLF
jgi:hypothetical protein